MKKSLCFNVACLILGIGLAVTAELSTNFAWAALGDGTGFVSETGKYCANKTPCEPSGCIVWGASFTECSTIHSTGTCQNASIFHPGPCSAFATYVCAEGEAFASRNEVTNACSNYMHKVEVTAYDGCI
jgi:hypothetical protein